MYIVYKTDVWHSYASRYVLGLSDSLEGAIDLCHQQAKLEEWKLNSQCLRDIDSHGQTQSYEGDGEFELSYVSVNELI